jgi:Txe/YoeB family toxin of Txe-Axe toxin-antitoxin module
MTDREADKLLEKAINKLANQSMTDHPITPPPELVKQWLSEEYERGLTAEHVATQAARWGADQELDACVSYVNTHVSGNRACAMRESRRPKPPSLKEQALAELVRLTALIPTHGALAMAESIRRALEQLDVAEDDIDLFQAH